MAVTSIVGTNSYISVEDADAYFNERLFSDAWNNANQDDKARALIQATKRIDRIAYKGRKANAKQKLSFPRSIYSPGLSGGNYRVDEVTPGWVREIEVSQGVKDAACEEAIALLKGISKRLELQAQGVKSYSIGKLSEEFTGEKIKLISSDARELLKKYMLGSVSII